MHMASESSSSPTSATSGISAPRLTGYEWYRSIGSPVRIVAPMVHASELPFRMLCRQYGAQLCYTPMMHARLTVESKPYLSNNFHTVPGDRPLIAQFCGNDPVLLLEAARKVQHSVDAVDLNIGCPQNIAKRGNYGAYLLEQTDLLVRIISTMAAGLAVPVTAKIRILATEAATLSLVLALQRAGASMLTIHGRPRDNMKETITAVDWGIIRRIKAHPEVAIPIVANGGIAAFEDVAACIAATGVDGVMSSEALLENPGLFSNRRHLGLPQGVVSAPFSSCDISSNKNSSSGGAPAVHDVFDMSLGYLDAAEAYPGADVATARAHLMKILFGVWEVLPDCRGRLALTNSSFACLRRIVCEAREQWRARSSAEWSQQQWDTLVQRREAKATRAQQKSTSAATQAPSSSSGAASVTHCPESSSSVSSNTLDEDIFSSLSSFSPSASSSSGAGAIGSSSGIAGGNYATIALPSPAANAFDIALLSSTSEAPPGSSSSQLAEAVAACSSSTAAAALVASRREADGVAVWQRQRSFDPVVGLSHPAYLADPAVPGLWYMRHRRDAMMNDVEQETARSSASAPAAAAAVAAFDPDFAVVKGSTADAEPSAILLPASSSPCATAPLDPASLMSDSTDVSAARVDALSVNVGEAPCKRRRAASFTTMRTDG